MAPGADGPLLTVGLLSSGICEQSAHDLLRITAALAVRGHMLQHSAQHFIQRGCPLVQQDTGLRQEPIQIPVSSHLLLEIHQLHILQRERRALKGSLGNGACLTMILRIWFFLIKHVSQFTSALHLHILLFKANPLALLTEA